MSQVTLIRGDTWQRAWILQHAGGLPVDLAGATARLHVRNTDGDKVMEASTADGKLIMQPTDGRIDLIMPKEETGIDPGNYRYDIEVTYPNGIRTTYEQTTLRVVADVTKD